MLRAIGWALLAAAGMVFPLAVLAAYDVSGSSSPEPFQAGFWGIAATVDIDPDTLNPGSQGNFVTAYIELPEGWDVVEIDVSTVTLEVVGVDGSVPAAPSPTAVGDEDEDGIPDRMVKFNREAVVALLDGWTGDITFRVKGEVSGSAFAGTDSITLLQSDGGAEDAESAATDEPPSALPMPTIEYEVQPGDTLIDIAARFGTTVEALAQLNGLEDPRVILYGSTLIVPYVGEGAGGQAAEGAQSAATEKPPSAPPMPTIEYEVQPGDTLTEIAARFGTTVEALTHLNGLENPRLILYGSTLNVPYVGEDAGSAAAGLSPQYSRASVRGSS